jgi:hypothetical protein
LSYDAEIGCGLKGSGMPWMVTPFIFLARRMRDKSGAER